MHTCPKDSYIIGALALLNEHGGPVSDVIPHGWHYCCCLLPLGVSKLLQTLYRLKKWFSDNIVTLPDFLLNVEKKVTVAENKTHSDRVCSLQMFYSTQTCLISYFGLNYGFLSLVPVCVLSYIPIQVSLSPVVNCLSLRSYYFGDQLCLNHMKSLPAFWGELLFYFIFVSQNQVDEFWVCLLFLLQGGAEWLPRPFFGLKGVLQSLMEGVDLLDCEMSIGRGTSFHEVYYILVLICLKHALCRKRSSSRVYYYYIQI